MELLAEVDGNAALFALTGASMSGTAKSQLGLR